MKLANIWYKVLIFVITYHKVFFTLQYQSFYYSKISFSHHSVQMSTTTISKMFMKC